MDKLRARLEESQARERQAVEQVQRLGTASLIDYLPPVIMTANEELVNPPPLLPGYRTSTNFRLLEFINNCKVIPTSSHQPKACKRILPLPLLTI